MGTNNNDKASKITSHLNNPFENIFSYSPFKDRFDMKIGINENIREKRVVQKDRAFIPIMFRLSVMIINNDPMIGINMVIRGIDKPNI